MTNYFTIAREGAMGTEWVTMAGPRPRWSREYPGAAWFTREAARRILGAFAGSYLEPVNKEVF